MKKASTALIVFACFLGAAGAQSKPMDSDRPDDFAKYHPLGLDEDLHARLTVVEMRPKLADLLGRMGTATGLKFTLADDLAHHDPDLGCLQLTNTRAYSFMEIIAERGLDNGKWEKVEGGYRLTGVSHTPKPPTRFR